MLADRTGYFWLRYRVELVWWSFVLLNVAGILVFREWATVPFHFIWISLTLLYGWRVWGLQATVLTLAAIILLTGASLGYDVLAGYQAPDELTEIPLMSAVFAAMVLFVRRIIAAREEISRDHQGNLVLLDYTRQLVRHASHILRTPLTVALGYAEILKRTTDDLSAAGDAQVVIDELMRLKQTTDRLLKLAVSHQADFVRPVACSLREVLAEAREEWAADGVPVRLGTIDDAIIRIDPGRLREALDELIGNAAGSSQGAPVEVCARHQEGCEVVAVADRGPGLREDCNKPIFDRFASANGTGQRGARLGLALVRAIAEAHGGSIRVRDRPGGGAVVELRLPLRPPGQDAATAGMPAESGALPAGG